MVANGIQRLTRALVLAVICCGAVLLLALTVRGVGAVQPRCMDYVCTEGTGDKCSSVGCDFCVGTSNRCGEVQGT